MIRVTVELIPFGIQPAQKIGSLDICNDLTGTQIKGNYEYKLYGKKNKLMKNGFFKGFARKSNNVWKLIYCILANKYDSK